MRYLSLFVVCVLWTLPVCAQTSGSQKPQIGDLMSAVESGDLPRLQALRPGLTDVNRKDRFGRYLLTCASVQPDRTPIVRFLLDRGAAINAQDDSGRTALTNAARYGCEDTLRLLIERKADLNQPCQGEGTALILAASAGCENCVRLLLKAGAKMNASAQDGSTALMEAAFAGNMSIVKLLVAAGANLDTCNREGLDAVAVARLRGLVEVASFLQTQSQRYTISTPTAKAGGG
jgi:ankyrin repeat protein